MEALQIPIWNIDVFNYWLMEVHQKIDRVIATNINTPNLIKHRLCIEIEIIALLFYQIYSNIEILYEILRWKRVSCLA